METAAFHTRWACWKESPPFWVNEKHGDLPKNPRVLAGIRDLLRQGTTAALEVRRRVLRTGGQTSGRFDPTLRERVPEEVPVLVAEVSGGRRKAKPTLEQEIAAARLEALALSDYLGTPPAPDVRGVRLSVCVLPDYRSSAARAGSAGFGASGLRGESPKGTN